MHASDIVKKGLSEDFLFERIKEDNERGNYMHIIPMEVYVSDETKLSLLKKGYKVYNREILGRGLCLIIEW